MSDHLDDGTHFMTDRCKKCVHVTELSIMRYEVPLTMTWAELAEAATREASPEPDDEGLFDVALDFEGYEAAECCSNEEDFDNFIDEALGWFQERGTDCTWKEGAEE